MSLGGAARRLLDPWAGLVLAALIVLGVVILLATPGPWRAIGGEDAPVTLKHPPTSDVAVYVLAGPAAARCTAVVWLHVDHRHAAVTATLVPAQTRCAVAGGGYAPVGRLVTDLDAEVATKALGDAIGVGFAGSATIDRAALVKLFTAAFTPVEGREERQALRAAWGPSRGAPTTSSSRDASTRRCSGCCAPCRTRGSSRTPSSTTFSARTRSPPIST